MIGCFRVGSRYHSVRSVASFPHSERDEQPARRRKPSPLFHSRDGPGGSWDCPHYTTGQWPAAADYSIRVKVPSPQTQSTLVPSGRTEPSRSISATRIASQFSHRTAARVRSEWINMDLNDESTWLSLSFQNVNGGRYGLSRRIGPSQRRPPSCSADASRRYFGRSKRSASPTVSSTGANGEGESRTRQRSRLELLCERDTRSVPPRYTTIYTGWQP